MPASPVQPVHPAEGQPKSHLPATSASKATPLSSITLPATSPNGHLTVHSYTPHEGEERIPITVIADLSFAGAASRKGQGRVKLRLVVGKTALATSVSKLLPGDSSGLAAGRTTRASANKARWQLQAQVATLEDVLKGLRLDSLDSNSTNLTLQALDSEQKVFDQLTFGRYTFWTNSDGKIDQPANEDNMYPAIQHPLIEPSDGTSNSGSDSDSSLSRACESTIAPSSLMGPGPRKSLLRRTTASEGEKISVQTTAKQAAFEWVPTPTCHHPNDLERLKDWTEEELASGRRLVKFDRTQDGERLLVSPTPISQQSYEPGDIVISCILRPPGDTHGLKKSSCYFTSVDIISLLEKLCGEYPFSVEEKNRIRRNLEALKPTTVKKSKPGYEPLFNRIMNFPEPKPRHIEKDVKVFQWDQLTPAIEKIISKYSFFAVSSGYNTPVPSISGSSSPTLSSPSTDHSAKASLQQTSHTRQRYASATPASRNNKAYAAPVFPPKPDKIILPSRRPSPVAHPKVEPRDERPTFTFEQSTAPPQDPTTYKLQYPQSAPATMSRHPMHPSAHSTSVLSAGGHLGGAILSQPYSASPTMNSFHHHHQQHGSDGYSGALKMGSMANQLLPQLASNYPVYGQQSTSEYGSPATSSPGTSQTAWDGTRELAQQNSFGHVTQMTATEVEEALAFQDGAFDPLNPSSLQDHPIYVDDGSYVLHGNGYTGSTGQHSSWTSTNDPQPMTLDQMQTVFPYMFKGDSA